MNSEYGLVIVSFDSWDAALLFAASRVREAVPDTLPAIDSAPRAEIEVGPAA